MGSCFGIFVSFHNDNVNLRYTFCFIVFLFLFYKNERRKRANRTAMSYPADSDTLEHLHPLTTSVQVLIKTIHAIRTQKKIEEINFRIPEVPEPPSLLRLIGSKNSFKEILDEKMKDESFRTAMSWKRRLQRKMCEVLGHPAVEMCIMGFILANTVVLALHHHQIEAEFKRVLDVLNLVRVVHDCHFLCSLVLQTHPLTCGSLHKLLSYRAEGLHASLSTEPTSTDLNEFYVF